MRNIGETNRFPPVSEFTKCKDLAEADEVFTRYWNNGFTARIYRNTSCGSIFVWHIKRAF